MPEELDGQRDAGDPAQDGLQQQAARCRIEVGVGGQSDEGQADGDQGGEEGSVHWFVPDGDRWREVDRAMRSTHNGSRISSARAECQPRILTQEAARGTEDGLWSVVFPAKAGIHALGGMAANRFPPSRE